MKILVVNDLLQGGGVERLMYDIVMRYHDKHEITILTDRKDADFEKIYPSNVKHIDKMCDYPSGRNWFEWKLIGLQKRINAYRLKKCLEKEQFDLLLCMKEGWPMVTALEYGGHIPRKIAWVHTDYFKSYYTIHIFKSAENELENMKRFNYVIGVSKTIVESIKALLGDPGNLLVRYNPIDKQEILRKADEEVTDIKKPECPVFVTVGRLNLQKGYDILLEVCNLLNADNLEYQVWIIGGGEEWNHYQVLHDLEEQIRRYHLDNVYLLGPRKNPYKYVKLGDCFLSSSRYEGYSYVSQEAAVLGKPMLLTECSGVEELLEVSKNGIMVENSYKGLYQGMKNVILHPEILEQLRNTSGFLSAESLGEERYAGIEELFEEKGNE